MIEGYHIMPKMCKRCSSDVHAVWVGNACLLHVVAQSRRA